MAEVKNTLQSSAANTTKMTVSKYLATEGVRKMINSTLGDPKLAQRFVADLTSAASVNSELQDCDKNSLLSGALLAQSLSLSVSPSLGLCYLVPFNDKKQNQKRAVFVLGYKGYIQLAMRSGYYKDIDSIEVREGEYLGRDPETGKPRFKFIENDDERSAKPVVGYMAYFEYINGFQKILYWSKNKMVDHADQYSAAFSKNGVKGKKVSFADYEAGKVPEDEKWKYSSFWYKEFDAMAKKTMLRQIISKWGIMSIAMQNAYEKDNEVLDEDRTESDGSAVDDFFEETTTTVSPEDYTVSEEK